MFLVRGGAGGPSGPVSSADGRLAASPPAGLLLTEPIRGLADLTGLLLAAPALAAAPRGDGHGVLVFPGLLASDVSTVPLRAYLRWLGYHVRGWDLGRNRGPTEQVLSGLPRMIAEHFERTERPLSLVGWSLGGIFAREMARLHPRLVRQVITLGSPFAMRHPRETYAWMPFQRFRHLHVPEEELPNWEERARPVGLPSTAVYSRLDGIVSWRTCVEQETAMHQNVEVRCSHLGFGLDLATLWLIADRLAVPAGQQIPFRPPLALRALYPGQR